MQNYCYWIIPDDWYEYVVVPILKPGKPENIHTSYRPIALASCILKTYERLIKNRIEHWMEKNNKFPQSQYGFRKSTSTQEVIGNLITDIQLGFTNNESTTTIFLDIQGAYDNVNYSILAEKMNALGLPQQVIRHIYFMYNSRRLYIRANNGLTKPRVAKIGLAQGSILSPLLYIIYTYDLELNFNGKTKILQFADDVCLYITDKNVQTGTNALKQIFIETETWFTNIGLTISAEKTIACIFSRSRNPPPNYLQIEDKTIPCKSTIKYLGVNLDRKLLWKDHIQYLIKRTENSLNLLRSFSHCKWGADPNICLLFYKAFVRSILDYGCIYYGSAAETHLKKIEQIKNKALRKCIGLLNSTPINILEAETTEPPLTLRRDFLSVKFLLRLLAKNSVLINKVHNLTVLSYTHKYWNVKKTPLLAQSYSWLAQRKEIIYQSATVPYYQLEYCKTYIVPEIIIIPQDNNDDHIIRTTFLQNLNTIWSKYEHIFTDGSLLDEKTGCAFYHKNTKFSKQIRLPNEASIYTAELWAILEAMKYCLEYKGNSCFVIFSDSKSALEAILNCKYIAFSNHIIMHILNTYHTLLANNVKISLVWIKAHVGIPANEVVDKLAKEATKLQLTINDIKLPFSDLIKNVKDKMLFEWQMQYTECPKGLFYKQLFPKVTKICWFKSISNRNFIRIISRIRTSHAMYPKHKKRIGISETDLCSCGNVGDLEHCILDCINRTHSLEFLSKNLQVDVHRPFNLSYLLSLNDLSIYKILYEYIINEKIEL